MTPRLLQQAIRYQFTTGKEAPDELVHQVVDKALKAVVVLADNVCAYCRDHGSPEINGLTLTPPFPETWIEYIEPRLVNFKGVDSAEEVPVSAAMLVDLYERDRDEGFDQLVRQFRLPGRDEGARWCCAFIPFHVVPTGRMQGGLILMGLALDERGHSLPSGVPFRDMTFLETGTHPALPERIEFRAFDVALTTLAFLNVKNVVVSDHLPSRQARRAAERAGEAVVRWKTLDIVPGAPSRRGGVSTGAHVTRAAHICRGHFATYTEDRPLFGKLVGSFWVPAHLKGSPKVGTIAKDYAVREPKEVA